MSKIFTLSEAVMIAIHAMVIVAKSKTQINADQIAVKLEASRHHVAKVMQRLVKDKMLVSQRGPTGGFLLNKKPQEIKMYDIFTSIEGKIEEVHCLMEIKICPNDKCIFGKFAHKLTSDFKKYLEESTLKDFM